MSDMEGSDKNQDQEKGDEVLRRLLKTPPDPKAGKEKPAKEAGDEKEDCPSNR